MAKSFNTLKIKLSAESKARIDKRVKTALAEMSLAELRQARKLTQQQIAETESNRLWYPKWRVRLICISRLSANISKPLEESWKL